jgi:hypothetical protein
VAISQSADIDIHSLIWELAASLVPPQRSGFLDAAHAVLGEIDCNHLGPGLVYRRLRDLQRRYFDPPSDGRTVTGARHHRISKLAEGPPIGADDPRTNGRARNALRAD